MCPFSVSPARAVRRALTDRIVGQSQAVEQIVDAFSFWESSLKHGDTRPLVLALTGSTGVGKTEAAMRIADALTSTQSGSAAEDRISGGARGLADRPGVVLLSGSEFGRAASAAVPELRHRLKREVAQVLYHCHGVGVIILDEAQKNEHRRA